MKDEQLTMPMILADWWLTANMLTTTVGMKTLGLSRHDRKRLTEAAEILVRISKTAADSTTTPFPEFVAALPQAFPLSAPNESR